MHPNGALDRHRESLHGAVRNGHAEADALCDGANRDHAVPFGVDKAGGDVAAFS